MLTAVLAATAPATASPTPAPLEPVDVQTVSVPDGWTVTTMGAPWTRDGEFLIAEGSHAGRKDLFVVRPDGTGFRCITCALPAGHDAGSAKTEPFPDDRRLLVFGRRETPRLPDIGFSVLECEDALARCGSPRVMPVRLRRQGLREGVQNREARLSPDGRMLAWTEVRAAEGAVMLIGRLVRGDEEYTVEDPRVLNPPYDIGTPPLDPGGTQRDWHAATPFYEGKRFSADGRHFTYAADSDALNFDIFEVDLLTGEHRRITRHREWDEDGVSSPDRSAFAVFSGTGQARMDALTRLRRPGYLDFASFVPLGGQVLHSHRNACMQEPWLVDIHGHRDGYHGQRLNPDLPRGWRSKPVVSWKPDGTAVSFTQTSSETSQADRQLVVASLPARQPHPPTAAATPFPEWAPTAESYDGFFDTQVLGHVVSGAHSGTATLHYVGSFAGGAWSVTFDHYSDNGEWVVSGTERIAVPSPLAAARYDVDLTLSGAHDGFMRGSLEILAGQATDEAGRASGEILTEVDGERFTGLPTPETCPYLPKTALRLDDIHIADAGPGRIRVRARVTAREVEDVTYRPVRHATVTVDDVSGFTNRRGEVTLVAPANDAPTTITATAAGFTAVEATSEGTQ